MERVPYLSITEMEAILNAPDLRTRSGIRDQAMLHLGFAAGLRVSEFQSNPAPALGPFVSVDQNPENGVTGPNIKFTGANIHILSGSGATNDNVSDGGTVTGLGNLIIGYEEFSGTIPAGARGGSHNLVIGSQNSFTSPAFGGLVAGDSNTISAEGASVSGGGANTADVPNSVVLGGEKNAASGVFSVVLGGFGIINSTDNSIRPQPPFSP